MRLGTTSYIYAADIVPNVRKLAGRVDDIELVLFEVDDTVNNLPTEKTVQELRRIAADSDLTYTVHLPIDLLLANDENAISLNKAIRVIGRTVELSPHGFVVHVQGAANSPTRDFRRALENSSKGLEILGSEDGGLEKLCVENLDSELEVPIDLLLDRLPVSCCVDVGHLWKQGIDPLPCLEKWLPRARVVHLHGLDQRDHKSLSLMPEAETDRVIALLSERFDGVLTLEVFSEQDLVDSLETYHRSLQRVAGIVPK